MPTPPSLKYNTKLCGGRPPAGPPPSTAGQHLPDRLLQPKMGWLNLSSRKYANGSSNACRPGANCGHVGCRLRRQLHLVYVWEFGYVMNFETRLVLDDDIKNKCVRNSHT